MINWYFVITNYQSFRIIVITILFPPWMLLHVPSSDSLCGIYCKHLAYKILKLNWYMTWYVILTIQNLTVKFGSIFILKWKKATYHSKKNDSCTPYVHHQWLIGSFALDHLGSSIARRTTSSPQSFLRFVCIRQTKVHYSDCFVIINQTVLKFEISMHNSKFVYIFYPTNDVLEDFTGLSLSHPLLAHNVVK